MESDRQNELIMGKKYKVVSGKKFPNNVKVGRLRLISGVLCNFETNMGCVNMDINESVFERVKKKRKYESWFQTMFRDFIIEDPVYPTCVWELKVEKTNRFLFSQVKEHQVEGLLKAKNGEGIFHKISDMPIFSGQKTRFCSPKPFDCLFIRGAAAYVVIWFYKPRQKKVMYWINIDTFLRMKAQFNHDNKKSCTESELAYWAEMQFEFKDLAAKKRSKR